MNDQVYIDRFRGARQDPKLVVLEGFHAIKHAVRFKAELLEILGSPKSDIEQLMASHAPDISEVIANKLEVVSPVIFDQLSPITPPTGVIALARRPRITPDQLMNHSPNAPVILLENLRNLLNIGAAIRVAAAAEAGGVLTTGTQDPWHPAATIAAAGLQFALPVTRTDAVPASNRVMIAVDPLGQPLGQNTTFPSHSIIAFGAERVGLSEKILKQSDYHISIPMAPGVSSLNLATAVSVILYSWKLTSDHRS